MMFNADTKLSTVRRPFPHQGVAGIFRRRLKGAIYVGFVSWLLQAPTIAFAQDATVKEARRDNLIGRPAPPLCNCVAIGPNVGPVSLEAFKGNIVVINFWATWCGACVREIPKFNEIAIHFRGRPITFLAISNENEQVLEEFVDKTKIEAVVLADSSSATSDAYGVTSRPDFVILGPEGNVARIVNWDQITISALDKAIQGDFSEIQNQPLDRSLPSKASANPNPNWYVESRDSEQLAKTAFEATLQLSNAEGMVPLRELASQGIWSGDGWSLEDLIVTGWNKSIYDLELRYDDLSRRYRFGIKVRPDGWNPSRFQAEVRKLVQSSFEDVIIEEQVRRRNVILIEKESAESPNLRPSSPGKQTGHDFRFGNEKSNLRVENVPVDRLMVILGICFRSVQPAAEEAPVLDHSGLRGNIDVLPIEWETGNEDSFRQALSKCGLTLRLEEREIPILVIRKK